MLICPRKASSYMQHHAGGGYSGNVDPVGWPFRFEYVYGEAFDEVLSQTTMGYYLYALKEREITTANSSVHYLFRP